MNKVSKKGISLVVLIITIGVMLILVATVVLNLKDDDTITKAKEAVLREDILTYQTELKSYIDDKKFDAITNGTYYSSSDDVLLVNNTNYDSIKTVIPSFASKYNGIFSIKNGELFYISSNKPAETTNILDQMNVKY